MAAALAGVLLGMLTAVPAAGAQDALPRIPLAIGWDGTDAWGTRNGEGVGWRDPGTWEVTEPQSRRDGRLRFHVSITPPPHGLPVEAGPAVLFANLDLRYGRVADVGYGRILELEWFDAPACDGSPCTYEADVVLDARGVAPTIASIPGIRSPGVFVGLSLVRSFAQGEWLQVLELLTREGYESADAGTLRRPRVIRGGIPSDSLFPASDALGFREDRRSPAFHYPAIVEAARSRLGDETSPLATVDARLELALTGCAYWEPIRVIDHWGAVAFEGYAGTINPLGEPIAIPDGSTWSLTLGQPFPDFPAETPDRAVAGTFTTSGSDVLIRAAFDCRTEPFSAPVFEVEEARGLAGAAPMGTWLTIRESYRSARPSSRPYLVTAWQGGFLSLEGDGSGWVARRSSDGTRWRRTAIRTPWAGLPRPSRASEAALVATDEGLLLSMIVQRADGTGRLATWASSDGRTWLAAPARRGPGLGEEASGLQVANGAGRWLALASADGRTRLWSSPDGRSWRRVEHGQAVTIQAIGTGRGRFLGVMRDAGQGQVVTSRDGITWERLWSLPSLAAGPFKLGETARGVILVATTAGPGSSHVVSLRGAGDTDWHPVLTSWKSSVVDDLATHGDTVVIGGHVDEPDFRRSKQPWIAASADGGFVWRQALMTEVLGKAPCHMSVATGPEALVAAIGGCDPSPALWRSVRLSP